MEDYVTYEQGQRLKDLGFDWKCRQGWVLNCMKTWAYQPYPYFESVSNNEEYETISAPTLAQAQKWLRVVKGIDVIVLRNADDYDYKVYSKDMVSVTEELFENYEMALLAGIDEALELLKEK